MNDATPAEKDEIGAALRAMGLLRAGEPFGTARLSGGVSCDVWRVDLPDGPVCVKRALAKLRVAAEWHAPVERAETEVAWLRLADAAVPGSAPKVLGEARTAHMFAMEFLPPDKYPVWKGLLAAGAVNADFAARVGAAMASIHAATAGNADVARAFDNGAQFHALRLEPYLLFTADGHPDVAPRIRAIALGVAESRIALMQGDVSPKNILAGPLGPVFLDAETACYGDPAFDLAFCLNHLLLKCVWHSEHTTAYLQSFAALQDSYLRGVTWEDSRALDARAAALLSAFLLARIDGKSPVEYLTEDRHKKFVRCAALDLLKRDNLLLEEIGVAWRQRLRTEHL